MNFVIASSVHQGTITQNIIRNIIREYGFRNDFLINNVLE